MMKKGFTLIELLISISILAILLSLSYAGLHSVLKNHTLLSEQQIKFTQFNSLFSRLHTELQHIIPRPVTIDSNTKVAALVIKQQSLSFTRIGKANPTGLARSSVQRIEYILEDNNLIKRVWLAPDNSDMDNYLEESLLDNITELNFEALADNKQWFSAWPPEESSEELRERNLTLLPRAIKITLSRKGLEDFTQFIEFPR
ncbi:MAG: type II secretion system minor pseudopilin GspJ [Methyloprofundus sp.]|nr:type II secretion system minor pseudopilin GspJ [Methyloprofundus sp.]